MIMPKTEALEQDSFKDLLTGSNIVETKLKNKEYSYSDVLKNVSNGPHLFTPSQQALLVQNYSRNGKGEYDWRIPTILARSIDTSEEVLKVLGSMSIELYANRSETPSRITDDMVVKMDAIVQNAANQTMSYCVSYKEDKNSIINYLDEKISDSGKMFYGDEVVPNVSSYNKNAYRDMREILLDAAYGAPVESKMTDFLNEYDDIYNTNEKVIYELLEVCDEIGDTRSLGLKSVVEIMKDNAIELGHIKPPREEIADD